MAEKKKGIFERAPQTGLLVARLRKVAVGESISYADLSAVASCNVQMSRSYLESARRILQSEDGIVFDVELGVGLIRADDPSKVAMTSGRISRIKRQVRKAKKLGSTVNVEALTQDGKIAHAVNGAVVAILEDCTGRQTEARLAEIAAADPAMLQKQSKGKLLLALGVGRE